MYEDKEIVMQEYKELPYTVVKTTSLMDSFHIALKAEGLKKLIKNCHNEDLVHIIVKNKERTEFRISKYKE